MPVPPSSRFHIWITVTLCPAGLLHSMPRSHRLARRMAAQSATSHYRRQEMDNGNSSRASSVFRHEIILQVNRPCCTTPDAVPARSRKGQRVARLRGLTCHGNRVPPLKMSDLTGSRKQPGIGHEAKPVVTKRTDSDANLVLGTQ